MQDEWKELLRYTTWADLFEEVADSVQRLETFCIEHRDVPTVDPTIADLMQQIINLHKVMAICRECPEVLERRPSLGLAEKVLATARKVRLRLPEAAGQC